MRSSIIYYMGKQLLLFLYRILFRLRIEGIENIPEKGPAIIAPNHSSYLDPPLVGVSSSRPICFMAKSELFPPGFFNWFMRKVNAFPVKRDFKDFGAIREAFSILKSNGLLLVFPEGMRVKGAKFGEPKQGIGFIVYKSQSPVIPVLLVNTHKIRLWPQLIVRFGKPLYFTHRGDQRVENKKDKYISIAEKILQSIKNLDKENQYYL